MKKTLALVALLFAASPVAAEQVIVSGASGGIPGGSNTQCQYNNAGVFGGITGCTTNGTAVTLASPILTNTPIAPTAAPGTNTTQVATTAFVTTATGAYLPLVGGTLTGLETINTNATAAPSPITGSGLLVNAADGVTARVQTMSYGAIAAYTTARANGTAASPTGLVNADQIGGVNGYGWTSAAALAGPAYSYRGYATETWSGTANGTKACIATTANTTTTLTDKFCVDQDGSITAAGVASLGNVNFTSATVPANGFSLSTTNTLAISTNSTSRWTISPTGVIIQANASGLQFGVGAASCTVPRLIPNQTATTTGYSGDGTKLCGVVGGVDVVDWASTGETITAASATALLVGRLGATTPAFQVDSSIASQAAGLSVTGAATGGTVAIAAIDSGSNTNVTINAKGSGTIGIGSVSTGAVTITPATTVTGILMAASFIPTSATVPTNGMYLSAANTLAFSTASGLAFSIASDHSVTFANTLNVTGNVVATGNVQAGAAGAILFSGRSAIQSTVNGSLLLSNNAASNGITLSFPSGTATLQLGAADAASPVAQTLRFQGVVAGTSNTAGANATIVGSPGTGTGAGGSLIFQTSPAGSTGTAQNAAVTALTINSSAQSLFASGTAALPSVSFTSASTYGFYTDGSSLKAAVNGAIAWSISSSGTWSMQSNALTGLGGLTANNSTGYSLNTSTPSATVPNVVTNRANANTGLGGAIGHFAAIADSVNQIDCIVTGCTHALTATFGAQIVVANMTQTSAAQSGTVCWAAGGLTYDATLGCLASLPELKTIHGGIKVALGDIDKLKPYWFSWKPNTPEWKGGDHSIQPGFNAREIAALPDIGAKLTANGPDGKLRGVRYAEMVAYLQAEIITLKAANDNLAARLTKLEAHR